VTVKTFITLQNITISNKLFFWTFY